MMTATQRNTRLVRRGLSGVLMLTLAAGAAACSNAGEGAVSGAAVGALGGLAIGSLSGNAGAGAAIGAVAGGIGGAVIGDQNRRRDEAVAASASQPPPPPPPQQTTVVVTQQGGAYSTGYALGRLCGQFKINGTIWGGDTTQLPVSGQATGTVDKTYFVRLDMQLTDPRSGNKVQGTSVISQLGGRNLEMTNSSSLSPEVKRFKGTMDDSGTVFTFNQIEPASQSRRIVVRMSSGKDFTTDVWDGSNRQESYTFSWVGPVTQ
jgi:hypothetical protein